MLENEEFFIPKSVRGILVVAVRQSGLLPWDVSKRKRGENRMRYREELGAARLRDMQEGKVLNIQVCNTMIGQFRRCEEQIAVCTIHLMLHLYHPPHSFIILLSFSSFLYLSFSVFHIPCCSVVSDASVSSHPLDHSFCFSSSHTFSTLYLLPLSLTWRFIHSV